MTSLSNLADSNLTGSDLPTSELTTNNPHPTDPAHGHGDFRLFGLTTFLVADGMTFAGFFAAYLTFRAVNPLPEGSSYELELLLPTINTVILVVSSLTFHQAGKACRANQLANARTWLMVTGGLGVAFLASQMV